MNDSAKRLLSDLTRVTANDPNLPPETEEEAAALRESWLGWTQLLEAADNEWDTTECVARLQRETTAVSRRSRLWATAALAASLLVVLAGTWLRDALQPIGAHRGEPRGTALLQHPVRPDAATLASSPDSAADEVPWDDPLDQQLADAHNALSNLRGGWRNSDTRLTALSAQVDQFVQEMETGSL